MKKPRRPQTDGEDSISLDNDLADLLETAGPIPAEATTEDDDLVSAVWGFL